LVGNIVKEGFAGKMPAVLFLTTKHTKYTKNQKQQNCLCYSLSSIGEKRRRQVMPYAKAKTDISMKNQGM
ncbi:MAG: hypothetical protein ACLFUS_14835, partial [Candidatus Sumerlaeia bacterium]